MFGADYLLAWQVLMNSLLRVVMLCTRSTRETEVNTSRRKSQDYIAILNDHRAQALGCRMLSALMDHCKSCHNCDVPFDMTETVAYKHCGDKKVSGK